MFLKAKYFEDEEMGTTIVAHGKNPKDAKRFGRMVKNFNNEDWDGAREDMMQIALQRKFMDDDLFKLLLSTGDKILVEGSPYDKIWGVGLKYDSEEILDEENWKGLNLLGKVLMKVRDEIKQIITQKK